MIKRTRLSLGLTAAFGLMLAACTAVVPAGSQPAANQPAAAPAEPSVINVYNDGDTNITDWYANVIVPAFEKEYPQYRVNFINTRGVGEGTKSIADRALAALTTGDDPQAEVLEFSVLDNPDLLEAGLWQTLDVSNIPNAANLKLITQPLDTLEAIYQAMLTHCQPALRAVFDVISESDGEAVLFHCTAGKDRTGLIAALLLGLAGVAPEIIAEDYALTDQYFDGLKQELRAKAAASGQDLDHYERMLESKPETMHNTLIFIEEKYGSVPDYLSQIGVSEEQIARLRARIVA